MSKPQQSTVGAMIVNSRNASTQPNGDCVRFQPNEDELQGRIRELEIDKTQLETERAATSRRIRELESLLQE